MICCVCERKATDMSMEPAARAHPTVITARFSWQGKTYDVCWACSWHVETRLLALVRELVPRPPFTAGLFLGCKNCGRHIAYGDSAWTGCLHYTHLPGGKRQFALCAECAPAFIVSLPAMKHAAEEPTPAVPKEPTP